jgi:hypothetical protein
VPLAFLVGVLMVRLVGFVAGVLAFWAAHVVERAHWTDWFHGEFDPWFLNSGLAIAATVGAVALASAVVAALAGASRAVSGLSVAAGAFMAMTLVLFLKPAGPGTIFPIVMVAGGVLLLVASMLGAWAGRSARRLIGAEDTKLGS